MCKKGIKYPKMFIDKQNIREKDQQDTHFFLIFHFTYIFLDKFRTSNC
jgi:hypothetical protein